MRLNRGGFTLIELMISITILSIMILFLYQSYASLNSSNQILKTEVSDVVNIQKIKKVIYLDFSLALYKTIKIQNRGKNEDIIFFQSSNSVHKRYNPYITYILKKKKLYRLESLKEFKSYELPFNAEFNIDYLGETENFRVYKSLSMENDIYLVHIDFKYLNDVLLKIKVLNEY